MSLDVCYALFLRSIPFKLFLRSKIRLHFFIIVGFMEPKSNLQAFAHALKEQSIDSAIRLLATSIAVSGRNIAIAHVETLAKILALANVLGVAINDKRIDTGFCNIPRNLKLAEGARPELIQCKPLTVAVATLGSRHPESSVPVSLRIDLADVFERKSADQHRFPRNLGRTVTLILQRSDLAVAGSVRGLLRDRLSSCISQNKSSSLDAVEKGLSNYTWRTSTKVVS